MAQGFTVAENFTLKITLTGNTFDFYINDQLMGSITDSDHISGKLGYACTGVYGDYIDYKDVTWVDSGEGSQPILMKWLGSLDSEPEFADNGDAYHNISTGSTYVMYDDAWSLLVAQ